MLRSILLACLLSSACATALAQPLARRLELRTPDVGRAVENLPVQVRDVDAIEVDQTDASDPRRREIQRGRTAETSGADDQDRGLCQFFLAFGSYLGELDLAGVAIYGSSRDTIS